MACVGAPLFMRCIGLTSRSGPAKMTWQCRPAAFLRRFLPTSHTYTPLPPTLPSRPWPNPVNETLHSPTVSPLQRNKPASEGRREWVPRGGNLVRTRMMWNAHRNVMQSKRPREQHSSNSEILRLEPWPAWPPCPPPKHSIFPAVVCAGLSTMINTNTRDD